MSDNNDVEEILRFHQQIIQAHGDKDIQAWLEGESDDYVVASRGDVSNPSKEERASRLGPYIEATTFSEYRDLIPPIVQVSDDGTLGWLIAQVQVKGVQNNEDGPEEPLEFLSAWIELDRKEEGKWLSVGNVSNMRP